MEHTSATPPLRTRLLYAGLVFGIVVLVAEGAALGVAAYLASRDVIDFRPVLRRRLRGPVDESRPSSRLYATLYDPELGWVYRRGYDVYGDPRRYGYNEHGARRARHPFRNTSLSTYGDSFTHGDGVEGNETWTQLLGERFQTNAFNYGVGGYGPDQAVLRVAQNCRRGLVTPVVILGISSEDINRILGNVRAFYTNVRCLMCATNGPKPLFYRDAGGWRVIPVGARPSREAFESSVDDARRYDFWYQGISFPYSLGLVRFYLQRSALPRNRYEGLWELPRAVETLRYIVGRFAELSRENGFRGVVVFLPDSHDFVRLSQGRATAYRRFLDGARHDSQFSSLTFVDVLAGGLKPEHREYAGEGYRGHPSVAGHRIIADAVSREIAPLMTELGAPR